MADVSRAEYWNDIYVAGDPGWDKGRVAPPLARMAAEGWLAPGSRVAVLGAGRGHDALHLARAGFVVTAVDFAEEAAAAMREAAGDSMAGSPPRHDSGTCGPLAWLFALAPARSGSFEVLQEDLFALPAMRAGAFDAVMEHTCFCAIDPARRAELVQVVREILAPGGVFFGLFYNHKRDGGPPFDATEAQVRSLFEPSFQVERLCVAPDSFENRKGAELEFLFRRQ